MNHKAPAPILLTHAKTGAHGYAALDREAGLWRVEAGRDVWFIRAVRGERLAEVARRLEREVWG